MRKNHQHFPKNRMKGATMTASLNTEDRDFNDLYV